MSKRLENLVGALATRIGDELQDLGNSTLAGSVAAPASALTLIGHNPGITIRWLAHGLMLSHPGTVRLVDRLVDGGLIKRRSAKEDGRAVSLWLTKKGSGVSQTLLNQRDRSISELLMCLTDKERSQLEHIAEKLLKTSFSGETMAVRTCRWCDGEACSDCPIDAAMQA